MISYHTITLLTLELITFFINNMTVQLVNMLRNILISEIIVSVFLLKVVPFSFFRHRLQYFNFKY